jgi:Mrp family chromosome partitioning ATPase
MVEPYPSGAPSHVDVAPEVSAGRGIRASLRAHPLLIAVEGLVALLAALVLLRTGHPTYEASAQILVTPIPEFDGSLPQLPLVRSSGDPARVIQTAANLVDSPETASLTAERLGPGWTPGLVASRVDVLPEGESDVLAVTAKSVDAARAARVANEFATSAIEARGRIVRPIVAKAIQDTGRELAAQPDKTSALAVNLAEQLATLRSIRNAGDPTLSLSRRAEVPTSPVGLSRSLLAVLALFLGLAAGIGLALVLDMLRTPTVATAAHAVALTGLPVLARVPGFTLWQRLSRAPSPALRPAAVVALRKLQHQLATRRSLLLVGSSAGDGVTTTVAELGATLARAGHEVLMLDLDSRYPQLATRLGAPEPPALASLPADEPWTSVVAVPQMPRLRLLAVGAQDALGIPDAVGAGLPDLLKRAAEHFDYVLVDAPPLANSGEALWVAADVDAVVLVVRPGTTRAPDLENAVDILERADRRPEGLLVVGGAAPRWDAVPVAATPESASRAAPLPRSAEASSDA